MLNFEALSSTLDSQPPCFHELLVGPAPPGWTRGMGQAENQEAEVCGGEGGEEGGQLREAVDQSRVIGHSRLRKYMIIVD